MKESVAQFQRGLVEALAFVEERKASMTDGLDTAVKTMFVRLQVRQACDHFAVWGQLIALNNNTFCSEMGLAITPGLPLL